MDLVFTPKRNTLDVILVTSQEELDSTDRCKDYVLPAMDDAIAKTILISHNHTGENLIVVYYPDLYKTRSIREVITTLVHESVHCWDFIADYYGYTGCSEHHAYTVDNIFGTMYDIYKANKPKRSNKNA